MDIRNFIKKSLFKNSRGGERFLHSLPFRENHIKIKLVIKRNLKEIKLEKKHHLREKRKGSEDGSGFIPAASTSAKKQK